MVGNSRVLPLDYFFKQSLHIVSSEGRYQTAHLVEDASQAPNVAFDIVRHVFPDLRTRVVGRTCLGIAKTFFRNLTDVEVSQLGLHILKEKDIRTFHVPMQDLANVKSSQATHDLDEDVPDFFFLYVSLSFLVTADLLKYVAAIRIFHNKA